jgi:hypothetical protein
MTAGLREAMDNVRRSVAVLAARVREVYRARALINTVVVSGIALYDPFLVQGAGS